MHKLFTKGLSFILLLSVFFTFSASPALAAVTYTYDANGNMLSDGDQCYHYNEANQMDKVTKCSNGQTIAEYVYDYTGMRLVKKEFENGVLKKTIYSPADEFEAVKQASNGATANTNYYKANDELVAKKNPDGSITYYHNDHLGSSAVLSDQTGAVVEKTSYEPYGEVKSGGTKSKFGYTGQEKDNETGLNYYNARYYDPHIQRFVQPDTLLPDIYDPQQLNRYTYARGNPIKYTDPSGHFLDIFLDVAFIAYDLYTIAKNPTDKTNWLALGGDVAGAFIPFATGIGAGVRIVSKGGKIADAVNEIARTTTNVINKLTSPPNGGKTADTLASTPKASSPNPNGKNGGPAHQSKIAEREQKMISEGYTDIQREFYVKTPGGSKNARFGDLYGVSPDGIETIFQIGRQTKSGIPVARERRAIIDIEQFSNEKKRFRVEFDAYNDIE